MGRLHKFLSLKRSDKFLLFRAFLLLGVARLALWVAPLRILQEIKKGRCDRVAEPKVYQFTPEHVAWAVTVASMYIPRATCLSQALAVKALLAKYGHSSNLEIGVAKGDKGQLEAHAWVEVNGKVVMGGSKLDRYTRLPPLKRDVQ